MVIKRVDPTSAARIAGFIYAVMGFIVGCFVALIGMVGGGLLGSSIGFGFGGVTLIIILPIIYGLIGFIATFIGALVYNFAAGKVGGIQFDVD